MAFADRRGRRARRGRLPAGGRPRRASSTSPWRWPSCWSSRSSTGSAPACTGWAAAGWPWSCSAAWLLARDAGVRRAAAPLRHRRVVDSVFDAVALEPRQPRRRPAADQALVGVPALVWGCHMRARRRQGWWVCAFGRGRDGVGRPACLLNPGDRSARGGPDRRLLTARAGSSWATLLIRSTCCSPAPAGAGPAARRRPARSGRSPAASSRCSEPLRGHRCDAPEGDVLRRASPLG